MDLQKVIIIEDNIFKAVAIERVLRDYGITEIDLARTGDTGLTKIEKAVNTEKSYDLIITDMHFSIFGEVNARAGEVVMTELKKRGIVIPVVVCSSHRYDIPEAFACVFYNDQSRDLARDLGLVIERLKNIL